MIKQEQIIIVAEGLDRRVLSALCYAQTITDHLYVFVVSMDDEQERNLRQRWSAMEPMVPLILIRSENGSIAEPLLDYLRSIDSLSADGRITVILPRLIGASWWSRLLRNDDSKYLERRLIEDGFIVEVFPIHLDGDCTALTIA